MTFAPSSAKNCDKVMPNPLQIFSKEAIVGCWFLRYHVDMVDWGISACVASSYSDHPRCSRNLVISSRMLFISTIPLYLLLLYDYVL